MKRGRFVWRPLEAISFFYSGLHCARLVRLHQTFLGLRAGNQRVGLQDSEPLCAVPGRGLSFREPMANNNLLSSLLFSLDNAYIYLLKLYGMIL